MINDDKSNPKSKSIHAQCQDSKECLSALSSLGKEVVLYLTLFNAGWLFGGTVTDVAIAYFLFFLEAKLNKEDVYSEQKSAAYNCCKNMTADN